MKNVFRMTTRGALIVFEGLDRSGKTTQTEKLLKYLNENGKKAVIQRFPDRSEPLTGSAIDNYLRNASCINQTKEAIHLLFSANRWLLRQKIEELLKEGTNVIVDRYSFSGITYTLSKGVSKQFACPPELGLIRPDAVLYFDVDPAVTAKRGGFGDEVLERADFQQKVRENMKMFENQSYWKKNNANETIDEVHKNVCAVVTDLIPKVATHPIESLEEKDFGL
jgi:dTMP kinase